MARYKIYVKVPGRKRRVVYTIVSARSLEEAIAKAKKQHMGRISRAPRGFKKYYRAYSNWAAKRV